MSTTSRKLTVRVLLALAAGILFGVVFPNYGLHLKIFGDVFIRLIKMVIVPIVFCTISIGIGTMESMKKLGSIGGKALLYFEIMTTFALILGFGVVHVIGPGRGFDIQAAGSVDVSHYLTQAAHHETLADFFTNLFPDNALSALSKGDMLPVLTFAVLFGLALAQLGAKAQSVTGFLQKLNSVFFAVVGLIMKLSPVAVFGAMAYTVAKFGLKSILPLAKLVFCGYLTMSLFVVVVLGLVLHFCGLSIFRLLRYIKDEIVLTIGTASSETALPTLMEKLEKAGASKSVVGLVVPTGYSFNLDGTSIYLAMSVLFITQAYDIHLTLTQVGLILGIMMLTSKGAAAVPGSGFVTLAATLSALPGHPVPVQGIALLLGIDRFMSEARSVTNLIGNAVATLVVAKSEGERVDF